VRALFNKPQDTRQNAIVLTESGMHMACIKTDKPVGRALRRFLVEHVLPKLHRREEYPKTVPLPTAAPTPEKRVASISWKEFKAAHKILRVALKNGQLSGREYYLNAAALFRDYSGLDLPGMKEGPQPPKMQEPPQGYKTLEEMRLSLPLDPQPGPFEFASRLNKMHILGNTNYMVHVPVLAHTPYYSPAAVERVQDAFKETAEVPVTDVTGYMTAKDAGVQLKDKLKQLRVHRHRAAGKKGDPSELTDKGYGDMFADLMREMRLHPLPSKDYTPTREEVLYALNGKYAMVREMTDVVMKDGQQVSKVRPHAMFGYNAVVAVERLIARECAATA